jgi:hypothetical protein
MHALADARVWVTSLTPLSGRSAETVDSQGPHQMDRQTCRQTDRPVHLVSPQRGKKKNICGRLGPTFGSVCLSGCGPQVERGFQEPRPLRCAGGRVAPKAGGVGGGGQRLAWKADALDAPAGAAADGRALARLAATAEAAAGFISSWQTDRSGQPAHVRTIAYCGYSGTVAYSMMGGGLSYPVRIVADMHY